MQILGTAAFVDNAQDLSFVEAERDAVDRMDRLLRHPEAGHDIFDFQDCRHACCLSERFREAAG